MHPFRSLKVKLSLSFLLLVATVSGLTYAYSVQAAKSALFTNMQSELKAVASVTASQVDGDKIDSLMPGDEAKPEFIAIRDQLLAMRKDSPDVRYSYIMRNDKLDGSLVFVVDDTYGVESDAAKIGEAYQSSNPDTEQLDHQEILAGLKGPAVASRLYTDRWGTFLSGYAPVRNAQGVTVAVLGVDMTANEVVQKETYLDHGFYAIFGGLLVVTTILILWFAIALTNDLKTIMIMMERVSKGEAINGSPLKRKDEVGGLAQMVEAMEGSIRSTLNADVMRKLK